LTGVAGFMAAVALAFVEVINADTAGLRYNEVCGWAYGITSALDLAPRPTVLPEYGGLGAGADSEADRRGAFEAGLDKGRGFVLFAEAGEEKEKVDKLKLCLGIEVHKLGWNEGHRKFVTALFQAAYAGGDAAHHDRWDMDWPTIRPTDVHA
jgi:hypothetical protein